MISHEFPKISGEMESRCSTFCKSLSFFLHLVQVEEETVPLAVRAKQEMVIQAIRPLFTAAMRFPRLLSSENQQSGG